MDIKIEYSWSNVIDFFVSNLIIALVLTYRDFLLSFFSSQYLPYFIDVPKSYTAFIEGLLAGALIGIYIFFKKKINVISMIIGMWLYPLAKYTLYRPLNDVESWLIYLSELSMFIGIFCVIFHLVNIKINKKRELIEPPPV